MKKIVSILILIALIISCATISRAADASMSLSPDKTKAEKGAEVKVSIIINNFTREGTQKAVEAKITYDNQKLEYKGINWGEGWTGKISGDGTGMAANKSAELNTQEKVAEITYTVKENAEIGNTIITAEEILTSSDGDEVLASDVEETIEIIGTSIDDNSSNNNGTNNSGNSGTANGNKVVDNTLSEKEYPKTGVKTLVLPICILVVLASISYLFNSLYEGIVFEAIACTMIVFFTMLFLFRTGIIQVTAKFRAIMFTAISSVAIFYIIMLVLSLFGIRPDWYYGNSMISIGISIVIIGIAAFSLILDFDFIVEGENSGMPKYMEWYAAFGLMVTILWLYLEILKLLAKLKESD